ncbi:hypothetical protein [Laspinema olomoucense]|uniref:Uncharacterized protein n=1 Tax=Laspinema olomoucense D3b TaxID=2953688 RepID=A0ABT2NFZ9_9CYAN|nr:MULTISPECIES: hypothetical protein [unclassified Laspinema]MCT7972475.1 hypothetical protein [Laspinema sp. D3d]MCT7980640.1 hypothetical protein [Laspinema sp. D3b]
MGSICQTIHLYPSEWGNKNIYPSLDIRNKKAQNTEHGWSRWRGDKMDGVMDTNESHPIYVSNQGPIKTRKILTMEGGWYRFHGR